MSEVCPFKQLDPIAQMYRLDKYLGRRQASHYKTECQHCKKQFKNEEYYEWHLWTSHPSAIWPD